MARERKQARGLLWAWIGGAVLLAGVVAIITGSLLGLPETPPPPSATERYSTPTSDNPTGPSSDFVDASVADRGWVPEPITTDADLYIRSALEAAATFDTQRADRDDWLAYLDSWFTPDTRYSSEEDQQEAMTSARRELRQSVVFPEQEWDSLAGEDGRVTAKVDGAIDYVPVSEDPTGLMKIGTADVVLTFTRTDGAGGEHGYDERVRVSVQVLCGGDSVPTPDSAQRSGDCKVVRYFTEPMEP